DLRIRQGQLKRNRRIGKYPRGSAASSCTFRIGIETLRGITVRSAGARPILFTCPGSSSVSGAEPQNHMSATATWQKSLVQLKRAEANVGAGCHRRFSVST